MSFLKALLSVFDNLIFIVYINIIHIFLQLA